MPLLTTIPGVAWILGYTIAAEIGEIDRFASPTKLCGYTGLCPRVYQSGAVDRRGKLAKNGPKYLRWALIEAAQHAARGPHYKPLYERTKQRLGRSRGTKVARITVARKLAEGIWHMTTRNEPFAPAGATRLSGLAKAHVGDALPEQRSPSGLLADHRRNREMSDARHLQPIRGP